MSMSTKRKGTDMKLTLSVVADIVMDDEALDAMLRDMTMRELE